MSTFLGVVLALVQSPFVQLAAALITAGWFVVRWFETAIDQGVTTYTLRDRDGSLEPITRADRDALVAQGWVEYDVTAIQEGTP